jgi:hypothetical protein
MMLKRTLGAAGAALVLALSGAGTAFADHGADDPPGHHQEHRNGGKHHHKGNHHPGHGKEHGPNHP